MKIGILSAIDAQKSKINWGGSPVDAYLQFIGIGSGSFEGAGFDLTKGEFPPSVEECDAYVITGSPRGAYDSDPWIGELIQFIRDGVQAGKKFVGICFGHQVLAHALGGLTEKSEKGWGLGMKTHEISQSKTWMNGSPEQMKLYFAHQDQVRRLPPNAELLGGNEFCPIGMYVIEDQVLGIQGHPEFSEGHIRDVLKQRRLQGYAAEADRAEETLHNGSPDNDMVAEWIVNFLGLANSQT